MTRQHAADRSRRYGELAQSFYYPDAESPALSGQAYLECFDQATSKTACSLYEGSYNHSERNTLFEELLRFYNFFGLHRAEAAELPDHIGVELEFMHYLSFLEYSAITRGEETGGLKSAQKDFLKRHLLTAISGICASFTASDSAYRALVEQARQFIENDLDRLECAPPD